MASDLEGTSSKLNIFANIFISFIGSGILGLPYAFKEAGIIEGILIMVAVGGLSINAMLLLLDCKDKIVHQPIKSPTRMENGTTAPLGSIDYGEVGQVALGNIGRYLVEGAIIISQIGFCCAYLIFIPENLVEVLQDVPAFGSCTKVHYLFMMLPPLMLLCNLRHLKNLGPFSVLAQVANLFAFLIVLWFDMKHFTALMGHHIKTVSLDGLPFFTGIAIYCFEGAGLVLSLENSVVEKARSGFKRIFIIALSIITGLYILFGVSGYVSFGAETEQMITLNLPAGLFPKFVISCLCYSLLFTYPIMMFPVSKIVEKKLWNNSCDGHMGLSFYVKGVILRLSLVIVSVIVVLLIPNFSILMALVGSGCCTLLAFILPAIFHLKICKDDQTWPKILVDIVLILVGVIGAIIGLQDALVRLYAVHTGEGEDVS